MYSGATKLEMLPKVLQGYLMFDNDVFLVNRCDNNKCMCDFGEDINWIP